MKKVFAIGSFLVVCFFVVSFFLLNNRVEDEIIDTSNFTQESETESIKEEQETVNGTSSWGYGEWYLGENYHNVSELYFVTSLPEEFDSSEATHWKNGDVDCYEIKIQDDVSEESTESEEEDKYKVYVVCQKSIQVESLEGTFDQMASLTKVDGLSCFDCSSVKTMSRMFRNTKVTDIDLSYMDFRSVEDMSEMCKDSFIESFSISNTNLASLKTTESMFSGCTLLQRIDFEQVDTPSLENTSYMFYKTEADIDVDGVLDTSKVTNMSHMFHGTNFVSEEFIAGLNTEKCEDFSWMFSAYYCDGMDFSSSDFSSAKDMSYMFADCSTTIDLTISGKAPQLESCAYMFVNCYNIDGLIFSLEGIPDGLDCTSMFQNCCYVSELDLSCLDGINIISEDIFIDCNWLTSVLPEEFEKYIEE